MVDSTPFIIDFFCGHIDKICSAKRDQKGPNIEDHKKCLVHIFETDHLVYHKRLFSELTNENGVTECLSFEIKPQ